MAAAAAAAAMRRQLVSMPPSEAGDDDELAQQDSRRLSRDFNLREASFRELLDLLEQRHEQELESLRLANAALSSQLGDKHVSFNTSPDNGSRDEKFGRFVSSPAAAAGGLPSPSLQLDSPSMQLGNDGSMAEGNGTPNNRVSFDGRVQRTRSLRSNTVSLRSSASGFPLRNVWDSTELAKRSLEGLGRTASKTHPAKNSDVDFLMDLDHSTTLQANASHWFISIPTSPWRLAWDFIGAVLIFYDLFKIPMTVFGPPESEFSETMDWVVLVFWTLNIVASVTVGHIDHGVIVMDLPSIVKKYLKTWFVVDLVVTLPDWVFQIASLAFKDKGQSVDQEESVKLLRTLRLARLIRLLRLLKLHRMLETLEFMINSEHLSVMTNLVKMIMLLLAINHLICCMWYWISDPRNTSEQTWVSTQLDMNRPDTIPYMYSTAFHWSITQFTPASMDVFPVNVKERAYCVVVVVFALVGFSYIVGSITGSLTQLRNLYAEESKMFWDLRRYLTKNKVSPGLALRIRKYLEHTWQSIQDNTPVKDVKLMGLLSEQLNAELMYELSVPQLKIHPFLEELCKFSNVTVYRLAKSALGHEMIAPGDSLFHPGEVAKKMYIVVEGRLLYKKAQVGENGTEATEFVDKGQDWIAEPALWTDRWVHCGTLTAIREGDNLTIDSTSFSDQVSLNPQAHVFTSEYARNFLEWLQHRPPDQLSDIYQGEEVRDLFKGFVPEDLWTEEHPEEQRGSFTLMAPFSFFADAHGQQAAAGEHGYGAAAGGVRHSTSSTTEDPRSFQEERPRTL